jgi:hypothetical protein
VQGLMLEIIFWAQSVKEMESLGSNAWDHLLGTVNERNGESGV